MLTILIPQRRGIFTIAAKAFADLWKEVTGTQPEVRVVDEGQGDLVVLGSDAVNAFAHERIMEGVIPPFDLIRGEDGYQLRSAEGEGGRHMLFIAGGRPRALLYGVYRFFELQAGCHYFWDGDRIPRQEQLTIAGVRLLEMPRFSYRGLRYFAHRSLGRFQAEHWDFQEWKREIDWMLKRRLNLFMLRIGLDDLFQKAFPETVSYPVGYEIPEAIERSYDDRTLFWTLKQRGELRRKVLAYARERDLWHPEDVGTMTHWYSRTPYEYLQKVKPAFIPQASKDYSEATGLVWDVRKDEHLEAYWKLTEAHIREYGSPELFHTIGLAERNCYDNREKNHQMKLYAYRRIISKLREHYPNAPLLVGSWDFACTWTTEEVKKLLKELEPEHTLILDYTSDTTDEVNNFQNWNLLGRFPWVFGIFHAYEPDTDIRGNYDQIQRRLPEADRDPYCKGLILWPECSHTDILMLEYMTENAWQPQGGDIEDFLPEFCRRRYGDMASVMLEVWQKVLPLARLVGWPGPRDPVWSCTTYSQLPFRLLKFSHTVELSPAILGHYEFYERRLGKAMALAAPGFRLLAEQSGADPSDSQLRRDLVDLARTLVKRIQVYGLCRLMLALGQWQRGELDREVPLRLLECFEDVLILEGRVLDAHEDYSLFDSLRNLEGKYETNPHFEYTLKGNAENGYCRSTISELFPSIYIPEMNIWSAWLRGKLSREERSDWKRPKALFEAEAQAIRQHFYETPLSELAPDHEQAWQELPKTLQRLADIADKLLVKHC